MEKVTLTIKDLNFVDQLSEETLCFTATVYVDGQRAFTASNRGHGGCNDYHIVDRALWNRAAEWVNSLPSEVRDLFPDGLKQDMDMVVGNLVADELERRERKRAYGKGVAFVDPTKPEEISWYPFPRNISAADKPLIRIKWETQIRLRYPEYRLIGPDGSLEPPKLERVK